MNRIISEHIITDELAGQRLDQALSTLLPEYSRSQLQQWIKLGYVTLDGQVPTKPNIKVKAGQRIAIDAEPPQQTHWQAQPIPLNICYEDEDLIVINKPAGLVVHPGAGVPDSTLVNALLHHAPELEKLPRAGIIHRLDKDTTGLLVIARSLTAHHALTQALQARTVKREYEAIANGVMVAGGDIEAPIGRHPRHRIKMAVITGGKTARTHYRVLQRFHRHTHVRVQLDTGRTHQIRVHFAHIFYPLVGDPVYGKRINPHQDLQPALQQALREFPRQALHAVDLTLSHPRSHQTMHWHAPLPDDMTNLLQLLEDDVNAKLP